MCLSRAVPLPATHFIIASTCNYAFFSMSHAYLIVYSFIYCGDSAHVWYTAFLLLVFLFSHFTCLRASLHRPCCPTASVSSLFLPWLIVALPRRTAVNPTPDCTPVIVHLLSPHNGQFDACRMVVG
ncbi:hypothetical protein B0H16DRAFT_1499554 [Mycena metata]|uniref:Uncharacterized protein n=1 Tax=Mycena metata TaxID=1033252 RepID=A0AAD7K701_9AGAR|nr:hypothetical protein B0H16DRAFT_1499554 [Mycena metata]